MGPLDSSVPQQEILTLSLLRWLWNSCAWPYGVDMLRGNYIQLSVSAQLLSLGKWTL